MEKSSIADIIGRALDDTGRTQKEVADELGYTTPNVISMFRQGKMKVPLEKVPALAYALEIDPRRLFLTAMREYAPATLGAIEQVFGSFPTQHERSILEFIRSRTNQADPPMRTARQRKLLVAFCEALMDHPREPSSVSDDPDYGSWR